jgi:hypothetical protein
MSGFFADEPSPSSTGKQQGLVACSAVDLASGCAARMHPGRTETCGLTSEVLPVDMKKILTMVGCAAWAAVAVSSASPADALAITYQTGLYATCASGWQVEPGFLCETDYAGSQIIKFVTTACSGGTCSAQYQGVYVTFQYPFGRTQTTQYSSCTSGHAIYGLTTCSC